MDFIEKSYKDSIDLLKIENELYDKYNVKKGLRNANGTGVLVGLTKISDVHGYKMVDGVKQDDEGHLYYRDIDLYDLVKVDNNCYGYERTCFLILFGRLPNEEEFEQFKNILKEEYFLPNGFLENTILRTPSHSLMNQIARAILSLYSYDENPDDIEALSILRKGISLIAKMPSIISYCLQAKTHYIDNDALHIHHPKKELSLAENMLYLSRNDGKYTRLEAEVLDLCLIIHADHGGGNNSTFVNVVVSSTGTDIYSAMAASMCSLKGPRHGGANKSVEDMMNYIIDDIGLDATEDQMQKVIDKILNKNYFDNSGLIYGIGHAVYTKSDPRSLLLKSKCKELCQTSEFGIKNFSFYEKFEKLAIATMNKKKNANYCANMDYYSGLTYQMLNIPRDLYTPIFAAARVVGWLAHNIENRLYCNKIIRPATKYVGNLKEE